MINSELAQKIYSSDDYQYILQDRQDLKQCAACNKLFYPVGKNACRQKYCKRSHYIDCEVCGKPVFQSDLSSGLVCTCSKECSNKLKYLKAAQTIKSKYGVENISQAPEFKSKISNGIKAKRDQIQASRTATMQIKYGGSGMASLSIRAKIENTMQERYGVKNPAQNFVVAAKISEICKSNEYQQKYAQTAIKNWGVARPSTLKEIQDKVKATCLEKYGVESTLMTDYAKNRFEEESMKKYGVPNPLFSDYAKEQNRLSAVEHAKQGFHNRVSLINQQVAEILKANFEIETEFEFRIDSKCFDLHVLDSNILIEVNPSYTHSDLPNHFGGGIAPNYHLAKTQLAEECGYRCIHIFDWDTIPKIGTILKRTKRIYARDCKLEQVDPKHIHQFIDQNHLQGDAKGARYANALFYKGELVEVMTFSKPRYNKSYEWELLRLCTAPEYKIVGGASRLFNHFVKDINPKSVISYCDRAKFTGGVYSQIGFNLHHASQPAKIWSKGNEYITDNLLRQRGFDQLFNANFGKGTSNEELMVEHGWRSVFDCGQFVYEWRNR